MQYLKSTLNAEEARRNRIDVVIYHKKIDEFCNAGTQDGKFMIVIFEKGSGRPATMALLKRKAYDATHIKPLPEHPIQNYTETVLGAELLHQERKLLYMSSMFSMVFQQTNKYTFISSLILSFQD